MASEAAKAVAHDVLEIVGKGKIPNKGKIILKHGYSELVSKSPTKVTETKSYKEVMRPFVQRLEEERDRALEAMAGKIDDAKYRDLTDAIDKLTKNHQLLTGGATQNIALGVKGLKDDELASIADGGEAGIS